MAEIEIVEIYFTDTLWYDTVNSTIVLFCYITVNLKYNNNNKVVVPTV